MAPISRFLGRLAAILSLASLLLAPAPGRGVAAPMLGFRETWPGTSVQGWGGSISITYSNPGTGGVGGAGDGFLMMAKPEPPGHFGTRSTEAEYVGDWVAAGITQVRVWLNDVGAEQALEIHFSLGNFDNLWQYDPGFVPPLGEWAQFTVDLTNSAAFTHIISFDGLGFEDALRDVQVVHLRHDLPPFSQFPDPIAGEVGIDELLLTNGTVGVPDGVTAGGRPVELAVPYPNPSRGKVVLTVTSRDPGPVTIQVVDLQGRRLLETALPGGAPGIRLWTWDGRDQHGRRLPAGAYRVRAFGAAGGTGRSLVRLD
jgi:hypothetical protein